MLRLMRRIGVNLYNSCLIDNPHAVFYSIAKVPCNRVVKVRNLAFTK